MFSGTRGLYLSAVLGVLCFPPFGFAPLAWIALVPFIASACKLSPKSAFRQGYLAGFIFFGGTLYWIALNSGTGVALRIASALATIAVLATVWALTAWAIAKCGSKRGAIWAVAIFVTVYLFQEVFWGTGEMGFPWSIWALTQSNLPWFAQAADLFDNFGLSLWILLVNGLVFLIWETRERRGRLIAALTVVFSAVPIYGIIRLQTFQSGAPIHVAAVQGNIPALEKWSMDAEDILDVYLKESRPLLGTNTNLIVWPETAAPVALRYRGWARTKLQDFADSSGSALFTGATDYESDVPGQEMLPYNAAFLIRPQNHELLSSAKVHLVPFGERIPGQKWFPLLGKIRLGQAEFAPAKTPVVFPSANHIPEFGSLVCFEVIFPEVAAQLVKGGAKFLVNVTQDGWFTGSSEPYQHLELTRLRAIASRRSIVRSANSGISALILPTGEILRSLGDGKVGAISGAVPEQTQITLAMRTYSMWLPLSAVIMVLVFFFAYLKDRRGSLRI